MNSSKTLLNFKDFLLSSSKINDQHLLMKINGDKLIVSTDSFNVVFSMTNNKESKTDLIFVSEITQKNNCVSFNFLDPPKKDIILLNLINWLMVFNITQKYFVPVTNCNNVFTFVYNKKKYEIETLTDFVSINVTSIGTRINNHQADQINVLSNNTHQILINYQKETINNTIHTIHQQLQIKISDIISAGNSSMDILKCIDDFFYRKQIEKYILTDAIFKDDFSVLGYYAHLMGKLFYNFITDEYWIVPMHKIKYLDSVVNPSIFTILCRENFFSSVKNYKSFEKHLDRKLAELLIMDDFIGLKLLFESLYIYSAVHGVTAVINFLIHQDAQLGTVMLDIYYQIDTYHKEHYEEYEHWNLEDILSIEYD